MLKILIHLVFFVYSTLLFAESVSPLYIQVEQEQQNYIIPAITVKKGDDFVYIQIADTRKLSEYKSLFELELKKH